MRNWRSVKITRNWESVNGLEHVGNTNISSFARIDYASVGFTKFVYKKQLTTTTTHLLPRYTCSWSYFQELSQFANDNNQRWLQVVLTTQKVTVVNTSLSYVCTRNYRNCMAY